MEDTTCLTPRGGTQTDAPAATARSLVPPSPSNLTVTPVTLPGDAPTDSSQWLKGAVSGEPIVRSPYTMCVEDQGFQCAAGKGAGITKAAGDAAVTKVDDDTAQFNSVATISLPNIKFEFIEK